MSDIDELTPSQVKLIEKNRQKALAIKNSKLVSHPYSRNVTTVALGKNVIKVGGTSYKDSKGGFLIEQTPDDMKEEELKINYEDFEGPLFEDEYPGCTMCSKKFEKSWLNTNFDYKVCDECKDPDEMHKLITRTEAMKEYLLKECDLDKREPILKFISRKNPHNERWGEMKLYLQIQIEERALEVWGSEEKMQEEFEKREEKRVQTKSKKYHKKMKELRMSMRSSLFDKTTKASHTHEYGPEKHVEEDTYTHTCKTCGFVEEFEKM